MGQTSLPSSDDRSLTKPWTPAEIVELVQQLSDTSYKTRTLATRRLCAIGYPAARHLRNMIEDENTEAALRARAILKIIQEILFSGIEMTLDFSVNRTLWDEAVALNIILNNPTEYPIRIPFDLNLSHGTSIPPRVRQVTTMLDVAEWLRLIGPDGQEVELMVDNIATDPAIHQAVLDFVQSTPSNTLDPGRQLTVKVLDFNRGWARYPLLNRGSYTAIFDYTPSWEDELLAKAKVGRVTSEPATIIVVKSAPPAVSRAGVETAITLERDQNTLTVWLTNRRDVEVHLNSNFGITTPFAQGKWIYHNEGHTHEVPIGSALGLTLKDFHAQSLRMLEPGERVEITRIDLKKLLTIFEESGGNTQGDTWTLYFSYMNLTDRAWQQKSGNEMLEDPHTPDILKNPLPARLITSRHVSNKLTAPRLD